MKRKNCSTTLRRLHPLDKERPNIYPLVGLVIPLEISIEATRTVPKREYASNMPKMELDRRAATEERRAITVMIPNFVGSF